MKYLLKFFKIPYSIILTIIAFIVIVIYFILKTLFLFIWDFKYHDFDFTYSERWSDFNISVFNTDYYYNYRTYFHYIWNIENNENYIDESEI